MVFTESLLLRKGHFLSRKRGRLFKKYFFHSLNGEFKPRKKGTFFTFKKVGGGGTCPHCPWFRGPWKFIKYHPASNGLAERAFQTFKEGMKKMLNMESLETRVSRFLFKYRITPHSTTGIAPAEMLMSRKPRSRLDVLHPDVRQSTELTEEAERVTRSTCSGSTITTR